MVMVLIMAFLVMLTLPSGLMARSRISTGEGVDGDGDVAHDGISCHACPLLQLDGKVEMVVIMMN